MLTLRVRRRRPRKRRLLKDRNDDVVVLNEAICQCGDNPPHSGAFLPSFLPFSPSLRSCLPSCVCWFFFLLYVANLPIKWYTYMILRLANNSNSNDLLSNGNSCYSFVLVLSSPPFLYVCVRSVISPLSFMCFSFHSLSHACVCLFARSLPWPPSPCIRCSFLHLTGKLTHTTPHLLYCRQCRQSSIPPLRQSCTSFRLQSVDYPPPICHFYLHLSVARPLVTGV